MQIEKTILHIIDWLNNYILESPANGFVIGLSGGVDSALTSTLAAKSGFPLLCLEMPIYQNKEQEERGEEHIIWLKERFNNVSSKRINLPTIFKSFVDNLKEEEKGNELALANTRARLRMTTLYFYAQLNNYLVLGTGNKMEDFGIGFFTKYGDGGVDINPIADLLKSEVYLLAEKLEISKKILIAPPTDGLWENNKNDEEQIGASYPELEWAMNYSKKNTILNKRQKKVLNIYRELNKKNQHKMHPIPICKIPKHFK